MLSFANVVSAGAKTSYGLKWFKPSENVPKAPPAMQGFEVEIKPERKLSINARAGVDYGCGFVPRKAFIGSKLAKEVEMFAKEETEQRKKLKTAEETFRAVMKQIAPEAQVFMTGSYAAGVDIHTSDLDFSLKTPKSEMSSGDKLYHLSKKMEKMCWHIYSKIKFIGPAHVKVLKLVDSETGVDIDVTMDNDTGKRNTQLLAYYGEMDSRFPTLCKAVKSWAAEVGVENSKKGRMNSFSICLMVVNYLQAAVTPPVLPCLQKYNKKLNGDCEVVDDKYRERGAQLRADWEKKGKFEFGANKAGLGELFGGFMKHYAEFDHGNFWISVKRGKIFEKRFTPEGVPKGGLPKRFWNLVVEDPFLTTPWNCSGTINSGEIMDRIQLEFKKAYMGIVEHGSIFSCQMSEARRLIEKEGRNRDRQKDQWRTENATRAADKPRVWTNSPIWTYSPYEWKYQAEYFWDVDNEVAVAYKEKQKVDVWPEKMAFA